MRLCTETQKLDAVNTNITSTRTRQANAGLTNTTSAQRVCVGVAVSSRPRQRTHAVHGGFIETAQSAHQPLDNVPPLTNGSGMQQSHEQPQYLGHPHNASPAPVHICGGGASAYRSAYTQTHTTHLMISIQSKGLVASYFLGLPRASSSLGV